MKRILLACAGLLAVATVWPVESQSASQPGKAAAGSEAPAPAPAAGVNRFNRLMKNRMDRNLPPTQDGIHDPASDGTDLLQTPREAFGSLPQSNSGNYINWVETLKRKAINPRYNKDDPTEEAMVFDLDIVREVKGTMPDVVYPHDRHTMWLDCSNCHPDIFIPEKGKNQISMAQILMGQKCGVCHGKVAFPVSECRLCHSKNKGGSPSAGDRAGTNKK